MTARVNLEHGDQAREQTQDGLFRNFFSASDGVRAADDETVREALRQCRGEAICAQVEQTLKGRALIPRQKGLIQLGRHILRDYFTQPAFHPELGGALLRESGGLLARAVARNSWVLRQDSDPVHELLTLVGQVALGWSPGDRRAPQARDLLRSWVRDMGHEGDPEAVVAAARRRLADFDRVRERRVEAVLGARQGMSAGAARQRAARIINSRLTGRAQPPFMAHSLREDWWPALQRVLTEQGEASELANRVVRVLSLVIWALQPRETDAVPLKKLSRVAEELSRELPLVLADIIPEPQRRDALVDRIEVALYSIIHGRQVPREAVEPLDQSEPAEAGTSAAAAPENAGEWFERVADAQRIWLASRPGEQDRIFFDFFGRQVLHCSPAEAVRMLDTGQLRPVLALVEPAELVSRHLSRLNRYARDKRPTAKAG